MPSSSEISHLIDKNTALFQRLRLFSPKKPSGLRSGSAPTFEWIRSYFTFSFKRSGGTGLRIETRIRTEVRIRASALAPVPYFLRCGTIQQRTTDPASASGTAFRTVRYASAFEFALAHQNKTSMWPDPSPVLGSGPSRTDPDHPGIAFG